MKISLIDKDKKRVLQNTVINKIRDLVNTRNLEEGDKLPSERLMSEKFDINRNQIREAIRQLEFYGVLKSMAQSGTILNIGLIGFNGIIGFCFGFIGINGFDLLAGTFGPRHFCPTNKYKSLF